ncbi:hypothetical protein [Cellulomonas fimi]|uniref:NERD domain-containing protein n=1 Tax=Cellulomonas fimi (strain ATCC 484 / DSM 20113 / JCM 1341 / CCUG 24087 / LMG 16345 / NBRC 15513 / NCIMB 8980 / NCTC 7547 / NRS-133) TaxID=590998 RepID=F4H7M3_CELFA|nr:hypothetical protein [Cellulomonas fimi]AEE44580.1 hypothetical protein Celf_0437 [Cellulomonas fimi ATCC 484]NNH06444.1 hypothetical protein [Cellulomonas fimi]VEH26683.1 Uncharacterised protein [Cellulomonas fimi]
MTTHTSAAGGPPTPDADDSTARAPGGSDDVLSETLRRLRAYGPHHDDPVWPPFGPHQLRVPEVPPLPAPEPAHVPGLRGARVVWWVSVALQVVWAALVVLNYVGDAAGWWVDDTSVADKVYQWLANATGLAFVTLLPAGVWLATARSRRDLPLRQHAAAARARQAHVDHLTQIEGYRTAQANHLDETTPLEVTSRPAHGFAGAGLSTTTFGENAAAGRAGEELTSALLTDGVNTRWFTARLVNGVRWPGTDNADLDHVVFAGRKVAVVDSKMWPAGDYTWDGTTLTRDGETLRHPPRLEHAVSALRRALATEPALVELETLGGAIGKHRTVSGRYDVVSGDPRKPYHDGYRVRGWVVVHTKGPVRLVNVGEPSIPLVTPAELLEALDSYFEQHADVVDRPLLDYLLRHQVEAADA